MASTRYRRTRKQPPLHTRKPVQRGSHYLNFKPRAGLYCVADQIDDDFTPLVCHESFQDALEEESIPTGQGRTSVSDTPRNVKCSGQLITGNMSQKERNDLRPVYKVRACRNMTKKMSWGGMSRGYVEETESDLAGIIPRSTSGKLLLGGVALYAVMVWNRAGG